MIRYLHGDIRTIKTNDKKIHVICQVVNDSDRYGAGVSGAIGETYPIVPNVYHAWCRGELAVARWEDLKGYMV